MSSYAIQAVSSPKTIIEAHQKKGFEVITVSVNWAGATALAKSLGMATDSQHLMVVSTLARKLHEARRAQRQLFAQPTLVVMPAEDTGALESVDWLRVCREAETSGHDVIFLHTL